MKTKTLILTVLRLILVQGENRIADATRRVLYGVPANPKDFPYLVVLYKDGTLCGGSVIGNHFILTAAHCVEDTECSDIGIYSSTWVPGDTARIQGGQCYTHENYDKTGFLYDIALIRTTVALLDDEKFEAIPLPAPGMHYPTGTPAVVVGWGETEDATYPGRLLRGNVLVDDWDTCDYKWKYADPECVLTPDCTVSGIPRRAFCTKARSEKPQGTCYGDSGGPVVIDGVIAGVVVSSLVFDDHCDIVRPSLNTNVADFLPWIYSFTEPERDTSQIPVTEELP